MQQLELFPIDAIDNRQKFILIGNKAIVINDYWLDAVDLTLAEQGDFTTNANDLLKRFILDTRDNLLARGFTVIERGAQADFTPKAITLYPRNAIFITL